MGRILKTKNCYIFFKKLIKSNFIRTLVFSFCITFVLVGIYYYNINPAAQTQSTKASFSNVSVNEFNEYAISMSSNPQPSLLRSKTVHQDSFNGIFKTININHLETLLETSKWREEPLKSYLSTILSNNLSKLSNFAQVWHFSASEFDEVQEWCLNREKSSSTNNQFLTIFSENRIIVSE